MSIPGSQNLVACTSCFESHYSSRCYGCKLPIKVNSVFTTALGRKYHRECFKCDKCRTNIIGSKFLTLNGEPICSICDIDGRYKKNVEHDRRMRELEDDLRKTRLRQQIELEQIHKREKQSFLPTKRYCAHANCFKPRMGRRGNCSYQANLDYDLPLRNGYSIHINPRDGTVTKTTTVRDGNRTTTTTTTTKTTRTYY